MRTYREGELEFVFPESMVSFLKFDDPDSHGLSAMKAVDFILEFPNSHVFVEVKDPDTSRSDGDRRAKFISKLESGKLEGDLVYKYRDSLLYRWCEDEIKKPVHYVVLLQLSSLKARDYQLWMDRLKRRLPSGRADSWTRTLVDSVSVLNIRAWNQLGSLGRVRRSAALPGG